MIVHMNGEPTLRDATVQDIQLELIRRRRFNEFDGQRVYDFLMTHRSLWRGVIMDRLGYVSSRNDSGVNWGLIKLRDLPGNRWNVDTLIVLTDSVAAAEELARLIDGAGLGGEKAEVESPDATAAALGVYPCDSGLVSVWWD